ncbi:hypothetical protein [Aeromonas veronii]|uniref:hypothetical protein n=1 Tax=Aeromonas veronii TaxID=654 RepID=UPI001F2D901E|nr:hypothetical protein [Aeromonas veronii]MCF5837992.1 hypothetical protein [Aeromonas veronii]MCF5885489.1 hypothetical protein [Aeromonas veronii]
MAVAPFNWDDAVQWDGPGAIAGSEEILSADRLERARYAEFLTKYLAAVLCAQAQCRAVAIKPVLLMFVLNKLIVVN